MKVFQDTWNGRRCYNFRRVGFASRNAFGPAWLCLLESDPAIPHNEKYRREMLLAVWKLWGHETTRLTNEKYDS